MAIRDKLSGLFRGIGRAFDFLRLALANLAAAVVVVLLLLMVFAGPGPIQVPEGSALILALDGAIVEQRTRADPVRHLVGGPRLAETRLQDVLDALEAARDDERITMLVLDTTELTSASAAQLEAIGEGIVAFKDSGKPVVAGAEYFSQGQYYLASFADEVYMHPMGQLVFEGYGAFGLYYQGLLERLKVNVHVFRVGTYKAAVEPYTRSDMSPEAREANARLVEALWDRYATRIVENRGVTREAVERYANELDVLLDGVGGDMARVALEQGLVDELISSKAFEQKLIDRVGADEDGDVRGLAHERYLAAVRGASLPKRGSKVGVIVARGTILMGEQPVGAIGAQSMNALVREARENDSVRALVVRVDSPGGSAFASELIRQELELTQMAGKPVVVSMGGVAASGGYWIASTADEIWAAPTTITGSIGVFGIVPTLEESFEAVGVRRDGVGSGALTGGLGLFGIDPRMSAILQASAERTYEQFLNLVARGREMTPEAVDEVGQGRVWSGDAAHELGLVDELGHLDDAVRAAARLAELDSYEVEYIAKPLSAKEQLLAQLAENLGLTRAASAPSRWLTQVAGAADYVAWLASLNDPRDTYAICEGCGVGLLR